MPPSGGKGRARLLRGGLAVRREVVPIGGGGGRGRRGRFVTLGGHWLVRRVVQEGVNNCRARLVVRLAVPVNVPGQVQEGDPQRARVAVEEDGEEDGEGHPDAQVEPERQIPGEFADVVTDEEDDRRDDDGDGHAARLLAVVALEAHAAMRAGAVHGEPILEERPLLADGAAQPDSRVPKGMQDSEHRYPPSGAMMVRQLYTFCKQMLRVHPPA